MTKCTKCGEDLDYLDNWQSGEMWYKLRNDGKYEEVSFDVDFKKNDFECPECGEILFTDEEKALKFLKGGKQ